MTTVSAYPTLRLSKIAAVELGSQLSYAFPTKVTNALGHNVFTQFDFYLGKSVDAEDANGITFTAYYNDLLDRPTQLIKASNQGAGVKSQTSFGYDDVNRVITSTSDQTVFNDPNPLKSQTIYDPMGRTIETRQYETASSYIAAKTDYDALGRAYRSSNPFRAGENVLWTTSAFDALGRVTSVTTPDSAVVTTSYSGNTVTVQDQAGKQRKSVTDALGRLKEVYEAPDNPGYNYLTSYDYDALDNLIKVTQGSQARFFMYDSLKRLERTRNPEQEVNSNLALTDPLTGNSQWSIAYNYDNNGNLTNKTDARGVLSTYAYDALNRNASVVYTNDPAGTPAVYRYYDGWRDGNFTNIPNVKGRLWQSETSGATGARTTINSFDPLGRPLSQSQQFYVGTPAAPWSQPYTVSRTPYNLVGGVTSQTYPSERIVSYAYDNAGRLSSFTGTLGDGTNRTYSAGILYSAMGGMTKEQFGTDIPLYNKSFYNSRGQLSEIRVGETYTGPTDSSWQRGAIINHYSDDCWGACNGSDNNGNVKKQEHWIQDSNGQVVAINTQQFDYDRLNRIQRVYEGISWQQKYVYDRYGNRTIHQTETWETWSPTSGRPLIPKPNFEVQTPTNRLYAPGDLALPESQRLMQYDAAGNLTKDAYSGAGDREYDAENRMIKAWANGQWQYYTYNADGQRVRRKVDNVETWQVYGFESELLAEYAANASPANPQKEYGYRNGQLLVTADVQVATGTASFVTGKTLGGLRADYSGHVGFKMTTGSQPLTITSLGRIYVSGNTGTHTLKVVRVSDNAVVATTNVTMTGGTSGQFKYANLAAPVTLTANTAYYVVSVESAGGDTWHDYFGTELTTTTIATVNSGIYGDGANWGIAGGAGNSYVPLDLQHQTGSGVTANVQWLVADQLGTPRMVFDQTGSLATTKRHDYLPFGEELAAGTGGRTTQQGYVGDNVRQKFTSKERDTETGLDYFLARYYSSTQGRFTSADDFWKDSHVGDPQSWNKYAYARNNPLKYVDPSGEKATLEIATDEKNKTGTIKIKASIAIWTADGKRISKKDMERAAAGIKNSIEKAYKGTYEQAGIKFTVSAEITVKVSGSEQDAQNSGSQNVIEMVKGNVSSSAGSEAGSGFPRTTAYDVGRFNIDRAETSTPAHEFGHLIGVNNKGPGNWLMNEDPDTRSERATGYDYGWAFGGDINNHRSDSRSWDTLNKQRRGYSNRTSTTELRAPRILWWR